MYQRVKNEIREIIKYFVNINYKNGGFEEWQTITVSFQGLIFKTKSNDSVESYVNNKGIIFYTLWFCLRLSLKVKNRKEIYDMVII